jgi:hypothetical protein
MKKAPQFIFDLLDRELRRIQSDLLEKVATKYKLDHAELVASFLSKPPELLATQDVSVTVIKNQKPAQPPAKQKRCMARVWNRGKGGQCMRVRRDDCDYCTSHMSNRKHGRIDDKVPRELYPAHATALHK